jgi:hypothetical protein
MRHSLAQSEALLLAHAEAAVHGTRLCLLVGVVVGFGQGLYHVLCRGVLSCKVSSLIQCTWVLTSA